ncbi:ABC transporter permease [Natronoglycomyces albus]|uniref:ABC transporter permease n=1 Tax=Natronoglycomyces albus TaxID=2811108 RepID=A0A895XLY6_9ACTN|nr:ABC transporter permease [Natronoglycomyces albus]QSB03975.1 ABC transporter permease [Natronoglycomyces albus]
MNRLAILGQSMSSGSADFKLVYTPTSWATGWMVRVLAQVAFYSMLGTLLGDHERTRYILIGAAVFIAVLEPMMTTASTTWERVAGTLPLLTAAPAGLVLVFAGRSWYWVATGTASSSLALLITAPMFGIHISLTQAFIVVPLLFVVALTTYGLALTTGSLALRFYAHRNVISNVVGLVLMAIGGFMVPVTFWPTAVQWVAHLFPGTHGLTAIRAALESAPASEVLTHAVYALLIGLCWASVAMWSFWLLAASGRKSGNIEFGD